MEPVAMATGSLEKGSGRQCLGVNSAHLLSRPQRARPGRLYGRGHHFRVRTGDVFMGCE